MKKFIPLLFILFSFSSHLRARCPISGLSHQVDGLTLLMEKAQHCPQNVQEFNQLLEDNYLIHGPSMVANRGRLNPEQGSFSFFETVTGLINSITIEKGNFFYGHFTDKKDFHVVLDQTSQPGKLLIELISWDYKKKVFNFYELRGVNQHKTQWFYRGDSLDALKDNQFLYRDSGSKPKFGSRMRCSACHNSGGPIMKELTFPHNDWWTKDRALVFGTNTLSPEIERYLKDLIPAENFAVSVKKGIHRLEESSQYQRAKKSLSLQQQLRPLFCETEINLESGEYRGDKILIPSAFFINPLISTTQQSISKDLYQNLLSKFKMNFPETKNQDADHPWLTPVKGYSDLLAIQTLVKEGIVSESFVQKILRYDSNKPLFSEARCQLLKKVPLKATQDWEESFLEDLKVSTSPSTPYFEKLLKIRKAVEENEISQNPLGQILEPGFRVIFPTPR